MIVWGNRMSEETSSVEARDERRANEERLSAERIAAQGGPGGAGEGEKPVILLGDDDAATATDTDADVERSVNLGGGDD